MCNACAYQTRMGRTAAQLTFACIKKYAPV